MASLSVCDGPVGGCQSSRHFPVTGVADLFVILVLELPDAPHARCEERVTPSDQLSQGRHG